jgi:hypothetical protein
VVTALPVLLLPLPLPLPLLPQRGVIDTQLIAHDREVYDIAWGGLGVFATVSADGRWGMLGAAAAAATLPCPAPPRARAVLQAAARRALGTWQAAGESTEHALQRGALLDCPPQRPACAAASVLRVLI